MWGIGVADWVLILSVVRRDRTLKFSVIIDAVYNSSSMLRVVYQVPNLSEPVISPSHHIVASSRKNLPPQRYGMLCPKFNIRSPNKMGFALLIRMPTVGSKIATKPLGGVLMHYDHHTECRVYCLSEALPLLPGIGKSK